MTKIKNVLSWVVLISVLVWGASFVYTWYIDTVRKDASPEVKMKMMANGTLEVTEFSLESYGLEGRKWSDDEAKVAARVTVKILERVESGIVMQLEQGFDEEMSKVISRGTASIARDWMRQKQSDSRSACAVASTSMSLLADELNMKTWWGPYKKSLEQCKKEYL